MIMIMINIRAKWRRWMVNFAVEFLDDDKAISLDVSEEIVSK